MKTLRTISGLGSLGFFIAYTVWSYNITYNMLQDFKAGSFELMKDSVLAFFVTLLPAMVLLGLYLALGSSENRESDK